jgi:hypothetical protein
MNILLEQDAPYFDDLVDGRVGDLQMALYDMDMDEEANIIEQIVWKLVNATILQRSTEAAT